MIMYVVLTYIYYNMLLKYSTFTLFMSSVKALIVLVSISYAGFRDIIRIIIVNNNVNGLKIYSWGRLFL